MASAPPQDSDLSPVERIDRQQRAAIKRAAHARSLDRKTDYRVAMDEVDRLTGERLRLGRP